MISAYAPTIAGLDAATLRGLAHRSNRIGLVWFGRHLGAVALLAAVVVLTWPSAWAWPAMAALGIVEMALFAPLHETTHRTPFRSAWLSRGAGYLLGLVLLLPPEWFRLFHMAHHRHTQDPARDPEIAGAAKLTPLRYVWRLSGLPYWASQIEVLIGWASGRAKAPYVPEASRPRVVAEARAYLVVYALLAALSVWASSLWIVRLWIAPALLGQPVLRASLMAEHGGLPVVPDRLVNTRTTLAGAAMRTLFWNSNLHAEHHMAPGVPFHALPRLHALVAPRLRATAAGYPDAHRQIARYVRGGG